MSDASEREFDLQVIICSGPEAQERALLGLAAALSAVIVESRVVIFFTMKGATWTDPGTGKDHVVPHFENIEHYLSLLIEYGAQLEGCTACVDNCCPHLRNDGGGYAMREGFVLAGLSTASFRMLNTPTVVF